MRGVSNTHAQNTCSTSVPVNERVLHALDTLPKDGMRVLFDWFSCTFDKDYMTVSGVIQLLYKYLDLPESETLHFR